MSAASDQFARRKIRYSEHWTKTMLGRQLNLWSLMVSVIRLSQKVKHPLYDSENSPNETERTF